MLFFVLFIRDIAHLYIVPYMRAALYYIIKHFYTKEANSDKLPIKTSKNLPKSADMQYKTCFCFIRNAIKNALDARIRKNIYGIIYECLIYC